MPPGKEHPGKGWAGAFDRTSKLRTDINQDSSDNQQRLNLDTARAYGLKIKPGYIFSEPGKSASKPIPRHQIERGIRAVVQEKAVEALIFASVDRLSRLGMRHSARCLTPLTPSGDGSFSDGRTLTAHAPRIERSSRSSLSRPVTRRRRSRGGSAPGVRVCGSRVDGQASVPTDFRSSTAR